jgi:5-methylcytosine-specific restriction endonuclease McrA
MDTKTCSKCGEVKALSEFYKHKSCSQGVRPECKVCHKNHNADYKVGWYVENKERILSVNARWHRANKDRHADMNRSWHKNNTLKIRANRQRRRARKAEAAGDHTAEQLQARFDYHGNKCVYCNSTEDLHADHQIPLSRGGTNFASNMVPACASCNISKGAKTPIEFADHTFKQLQAMLGK